MSHYFKLNFPVKFLRDDADVSCYANSKRRIFSVSTQEYITLEAFDFLCNLGLVPNNHSYIFLRKPLETFVKEVAENAKDATTKSSTTSSSTLSSTLTTPSH
jgi:hypothetical protein